MTILQAPAALSRPATRHPLARLVRRLLLVVAGLAATHSAAAQTYSANLLPQPNLRLSTAGSVTAIVRQSDGKLIVGGNFRLVDNARRINLARFNADGSLDTTWIVDADATVNDLALDASDNLFVAGGFTRIGGVLRNALAKLSPAGIVDPDWNPAPNSLVSTVLLSGNQLYIGGAFGNVGGSARSGIARVASTGTGALDAIWNPAPNAQVRAIVESGGVLFIGGGFSQVGGTPRSRLAKVSTTGVGSLDPSWNPGANFTVFALALDSNGGLIVGGQFSNVGGLARNCLAKLDPVGSGAANPTWVPAAVSFPCGVSALASDGAGGMLIGGGFTSIAGQPRNGVARVLDTGTLDASWNPNVQMQLYSSTPSVQSLLPLPGGFTQIGGSFDTVGSGRNFGSARLTPSGARDPTFTAALDGLGQVRAIAEDPVTGALYVGGLFGLVDGVQVHRNLLKLAPDLSLDSSWTGSVDNAVYSLLVDSSQRLYAGGFFTMSATTPRNYLARFDSAGTLDANWNPNANSNIDAMAFTPDSSGLYVGGAFTQIGGQPRNRIARVSTAGTGAPDSWNPNTGGNGDALAITVRPADGAVYVGGGFTNFGGLARGYAAKISSAGVVDASWNPNADNFVNSLVLSTNTTTSSDVFLCGFFTNIGGTLRPSVAKVSADSTGAVVTVFAPAIASGGYCSGAESFDLDGQEVLSIVGSVFRPPTPPPVPMRAAKWRGDEDALELIFFAVTGELGKAALAGLGNLDRNFSEDFVSSEHFLRRATPRQSKGITTPTSPTFILGGLLTSPAGETRLGTAGMTFVAAAIFSDGFE